MDLTEQIAMRRQQLLREADQERLVAQLPRSRSFVRHELALVCARLAQWVDDGSDQYVPPSDSGRADWVAGSATV